MKKLIKRILPLTIVAAIATAVGCMVESVDVSVRNARTAGIDEPAAVGAGGEAALPAAVGAAAAVAK